MYIITFILLMLVIAIGFAIKIPMWVILSEAFRDLRTWRTQTRDGRSRRRGRS
jgi:hypothetical protein